MENKRDKPSIKWYRIILAMSGCLLIIIGVVRITSLNPTATGIKLDFNTYYQNARLLIENQSIYSTKYTNIQTPFTTLLFVPLAFLPMQEAAMIWTVISIVAYLGLGIILYKVQEFKFTIEWKILLLGISLCWYPFLIHIAMGQINIVICLLIVAGWALLRKNQNILAGAMLGLAFIIKIFPAIFILYLIFRKRWLALVVMVSTIVAGLFFTGLLVGFNEIVNFYVRVLTQDSKEWFAYPLNLSPTSTIYMLFTDNRWVYPIINARVMAGLFVLILDFNIVIFLLYKFMSLPRTILGDDIAYGVCIISMLLITPLTWQHIFPILLLPLSILFKSYYDQQNIHHRNQALLSFLFLSIPGGEIVLIITGITQSTKIPWYLALPIQLPLLGVVLLMISLINYKPFPSQKTLTNPIVASDP